MKKIAFFITGLNSGGLENYLLRFLRFSQGNFQATVFCKGGFLGDLDKEFRELDVKLIPLKIGYFNLLSFWKLYRILNRENYYSVCDFTGDFSAFVLLIAKLAKIKKRMVFYRGSAYQFKMTPVKGVYVKLLKLALQIVRPEILSNSEFALDVFHPGWRNNSSSTYKVIYNGVPFIPSVSSDKINELRETLGISEQNYVIGHVGNFRKAKNHIAIIKIAKEIITHNNKVRFLLIGKDVSGGLKDELLKNNLKQYFIMPGVRSDIPELLNLMDVFLFPSTDEGQPNALIEAMIYGVPIFASNIPTIKECTPNDINENLFPPLDHKQFSNAINIFSNTGKTYDIEKVSQWAKIYFNSEKNFNNFLNELI